MFLLDFSSTKSWVLGCVSLLFTRFPEKYFGSMLLHQILEMILCVYVLNQECPQRGRMTSEAFFASNFSGVVTLG